MSEPLSRGPLQPTHEWTASCWDSLQLGRADALIFHISDPVRTARREEIQGLNESLAGIENMHMSSFCPTTIECLLPEIFSMIFTLVVDHTQANYTRNPLGAVTPNVAASCISSVCRRWRQVALYTPRLWSRLVVNHKQDLEILALWLVRSAKLPLDVAILYCKPSDIDLLNFLLDVLGPHIYRFRSLRLELGSDLCAHVLESCAQLQSSASELESFTIFNPHGSYENLAISLSPARKEALNRLLDPITTLHLLSTTLFDWSLAAFHDLGSLTIELLAGQNIPSYRELLDVLHASPNLCSLKLASLEMPNPPPETTRLELNRLESLCLKNLPRHLFVWLLHTIVPRPEGMAVYVTGYRGEFGRNIGFGLQFAVPERVKALYVHDNSHRCLDLKVLLTALPCLEMLVLSHMSFIICDPRGLQGKTLHTLELVRCAVTSGVHLVKLLESGSILRLRIFRPTSGPSAAALRKQVPGSQVSESDRGYLDEIYLSPYFG